MAEPDEPILIVFGTTNKGIYDILGTDIKKIQNVKIFNFFPNQATQTVRLEEAILGTLSIINILNYNNFVIQRCHHLIKFKTWIVFM